MIDNNTLMGLLTEKFPKTIESWDGYQSSVMANSREGLDPVIIVGLYNKPTEERPANLHRAFRIDVDSGDIESGDESVVDTEQRRVYPEVYARFDEDQKTFDAEQESFDAQPDLTDDEENELGSDRDMYLKQDMAALNSSENSE